MSTLELRRVKDPGKFEGGLILDQAAYGLSTSGFCAEEVGDVSFEGWFGLIRGPFDAEMFREDCPHSHGKGLGLTEDEIAYLGKQAGCIIREDSQGFVGVEWFDDRAKLDSTWENLSQTVADLEDSAD